MTWRPDTLVDSVFEDPNTRKIMMNEIFRNPDWIELDRGTLAREDAVKIAAVRTGFPESTISRLMDKVPEILEPVDEMIDLIKAVKKNKNRLFVLSNMHSASAEHLKKVYSFWDLFEGIIFSCDVHLVKPEPGIYRYMLDTYAIAAEETVFIDDTEANLTAAAEFGIIPIKFETPDQCRDSLKKNGCL